MTIGRPGTPQAWSAFLCLILAVFLYLGPYLWRGDLFNNDAAHHIFWLYRYADPSLFPGDPTVDYFRTSAPWGYRALYAVLAPLTDVFRAAEWMAVPLLLVSGWLAWEIGRSSGEPLAGDGGLLTVLALIVMLPLSEQRDLLPPIAFQRTFALPLLLFTLWGLVTRRYGWVGASWLIAAFFYPVVLPVQGLTAAAVFLRDLVRDRRLPAFWVLNLILGAAALAIAAYGVPIPPEVGPPFTYEQAIKMPEYGPGGRLQLYDQGLVGNLLRDHRTGLGWSAGDILMMLVAIGLAWRFGKIRRIPFAAWAMVVVGIVLWAAMRIFPNELMFGLYLPNRHSRWAIGIFGMLAFGAAAAAMSEQMTSRVDVRRWVPLLAPILVTVVLLPKAVGLLQRPVNHDLENVYAFVATLPKDILVAAHPDLADFVPVRTQRSVLASTEVSMAWMENYYKVMKPRVEASLRAAYATSIEEMDRELEPFGVDIMLTGPPVWEKTGYFEPFDDLFQNLIQQGARVGFALESPPAERILFRSGDYYVVRVSRCVPGDCP